MPNIAFVPTPEQRRLVKQLAAVGIPQRDIVKKVLSRKGKPISLETLEKHFRHELDTGELDANAAVAGSLYRQAVEQGNVNAAIFWLKTRARWKEPPQELRHGGSEDAPAIRQQIEVVLVSPNKPAS